MFLSLFFLLCSFFFIRNNIVGESGDLRAMFAGMSSVMVLLTPLLTVHMFVTERGRDTDLLLYSSPVSIPSIVLGKFFAAVAVLLVGVVGTYIYVLVLGIYGAPDVLEILTCQIGFFLLGCGFIAVGVFVSALVTRPIYAYFLTLAILVLFWMIDNLASSVVNPLFQRILWILSLFSTYSEFEMGLLSPAGIIYMFSFAAVFLLLACRMIEQRRERGM